MDTIEHLIVGGGPAGLRAAQVLAGAGREVLVVEKRAGDRSQGVRRRSDTQGRPPAQADSDCPPTSGFPASVTSVSPADGSASSIPRTP